FPLLKLIEYGTTVWFPPVTWIVAPLTVVGSTGPLNRTSIFAFTGTFVSPLAGLTAVTAGAVPCGPAPVVKQYATAPAASPFVPCRPPANSLMYGQYCVFAASCALGAIC